MSAAPSNARFIIDGSGWLYRAFHALPPLTAPDGTPTQAVLGFGNMLRRLLREHDPAHLVVVFDAPGKTFRHTLHPEYKAHRPPVPPELKEQFAPIVELVRIMGLPMLQIESVEADDVIATLAARTQDPVRIISSDKDLAQLVDERVQMLDVFKNQVLDPAAISEKFGVAPARVAEWLALVGDTSDNVPGLSGVGPKTASKWLQAHGDLDTLLENAADISGKAGETLRAHQDQVRHALTLTQLDADVALDADWADLDRAPVDTDALQAFAERLGFRSWLDKPVAAADRPAARSGGLAPVETGEGLQIHSRLVLTDADLDALCKELAAAPLFAVDTETSSLNPLQADLVGLSFATAPDRAWYLPVGHTTPTAQLPLQRVVEKLGPLLRNAEQQRVLQNGKFDAPILDRHGLSLAEPWEDTQLASYVLEAHERHDMDTLAERWLGHSTIHYEDVVGRGRKQMNFRDVPLDQAAEYAGEDAAVTFALHAALQKGLREDAPLLDLYNTLEKPLAPVLARMERRGIAVDRGVLADADRDFSAEIVQEEMRCHELAGETFNLGSPAQLATILFDKMGIPVREKTPKGAPSTAENVLEDLAAEHELPRRILRWRMLSKLRSTYTRALDNAIQDTGRVHCRFQQAVASTGRLSCADPNLQNIPIRRPEGRRIREAFVAEPGWTLVALDYSQIELRLMAHFSQDPLLLDAFAKGLDIHRRTAAQVWDLEEDAVSADQRRAAKAINFGLIYGISSFGLARQLSISRTEADAIMQRFFGRFAGVRAYMDRVRAEARASGEVRTLRGRRLLLPDLRSRNGARRQGAERVAINAPLQGTAADIIKQAMLDVDQLYGQRDEVRLLLQVHDELVLEVREGLESEVIAEVREKMVQAAELIIPLVVDAGQGRNWAQAHG